MDIKSLKKNIWYYLTSWIKNRILSKVIRQKTKIMDAMHKRKNLKWKLAGFVVRSNDNRWLKLTTHWLSLQGKAGYGDKTQDGSSIKNYAR